MSLFIDEKMKTHPRKNEGCAHLKIRNN